MPRSSLDTAKYLLKRRNFPMAIRFLENCEEDYEGVVDYYITFGVAYLYAGIPGKASEMFRKARELSVQNTTLLLGQAVIFLRRGETSRAVQYYLQVLDNEPGNATAEAALEFIRDDGALESIVKMMETGEIKKFYPPLGINPNIIRNCIMAGIALGLICSSIIIFKPKPRQIPVEQTKIEKTFSLSEDELRNAVQLDAIEGQFKLSLTTREIENSFSLAKKYFASSRDNACQVELNRIINSNASIHLKQKAQTIMDMLQEPTFDTLKDNYSYTVVAENPYLYMDCYCVWDGMVTNPQLFEDGSWKCSLLVDYIPSENKNFQVGFVNVVFDNAPEPAVDVSRPVRFLGRITKNGSDLILSGRAVYQPLKGTKLDNSK